MPKRLVHVREEVLQRTSFTEEVEVISCGFWLKGDPDVWHKFPEVLRLKEGEKVGITLILRDGCLESMVFKEQEIQMEELP